MRERVSNSTHADPVTENGTDIEMVPPGTGITNDTGALTQEEEDEALRRRPVARRVLESVFPYFTRPVGAMRNMRRRSHV